MVKGNFGKYTEEMPAAMLRDVEAIAGDALVACGYELTCPRQPLRRLSAVRRMAAQLSDGINLVRSDTENLGVARSVYFYLRYFISTRN